MVVHIPGNPGKIRSLLKLTDVVEMGLAIVSVSSGDGLRVTCPYPWGIENDIAVCGFGEYNVIEIFFWGKYWAAFF